VKPETVININGGIHMRKAIFGVLAAVFILSVETNVSAAEPGIGSNYVDADADGICDYAGANCIYTDADGDGVCDYYAAGLGGGFGYGYGCGRGRYFVDADGDGVCDYYTAGRMRGRGCGFRGGRCW